MRETLPNAQIITGEDQFKVRGVGTVPITVNRVRGKRTFTLLDTLYILEFYTSTVSTWKLEEKKIFWDLRNKYFVYEGKTVFYIDKNFIYCQYIVEYNKLVPETAFSVTVKVESHIAKAIVNLWYKHLKYLNFETISYFETATTDAKIILKNKYYIQLCETCKVSKAKQMISRTPQEQAITLFKHVHFDIIYFTDTLN